jgi:hypothetical protein
LGKGGSGDPYGFLGDGRGRWKAQGQRLTPLREGAEGNDQPVG